MKESVIKKAIRSTFRRMYEIKSITVNIEKLSTHEDFDVITVVIVEKDMTIKKLVFDRWCETCYEYNYIADIAIRNEFKWIYERFLNNVRIIENGGY